MTWEEAVLWLREQSDQAELVRACFYDDPLLAAAERYHASSEWKAVQALLPATAGAALDLGAGRGIASYALARDGWRTVALEPDPSPIVGAGAIRTLATQSGLSMEVRQDWGEQLPFDSGTFDLVFGRAVMHHARDLFAFCREAARVLREGGLFIGAREHVISRAADLRAFLDSHPLHRHYGGENAHLLRDYLDALRRSGLEITRVFNPFASDINLFPDSRRAIRQRTASALKLPSLQFVPGFALDLLGALRHDPGRLYTFVAKKPHA